MRHILLSVLMLLSFSGFVWAEGVKLPPPSTPGTKPVDEVEQVIINRTQRAIKYYDSAGDVTKVELFNDSNVTDYHDASTTGSIAWAQNQLPAIGGTIFLNDGTYNVGQRLDITTGTRLIGSGMHTTILFLSAGSDSDVLRGEDVSNIYIGYLQVDGNRDNNTKGGTDSDDNCIQFRSVANGTIDSVYLTDAGYHGVFVVGSSSQITTKNCVLTANGYRGLHYHGDDTPKNVTYSYIINNICHANAVDGAAGDDSGLFATLDNTYNIICSGNIVYDEPGTGIEIAGEVTAGTDCKANLFTDNNIDNCQHAFQIGGNANFFTISNNIITDSTDKAINVVQASDCLINNNLILDGAEDAIQFESSTYGRIQINNNVIIGNDGGGIYVRNCDYCQAVGNLLDDNLASGDTGKEGIMWRDSDYGIIANNTILSTNETPTNNAIREFGTSDWNNITDNNTNYRSAGNEFAVVGTNTQLLNNWGRGASTQYEELANATGFTLSGVITTRLKCDTANGTGTLGNGAFPGQLKTIFCGAANPGTYTWQVTITNHATSDPEVVQFDAVDEYILLIWTGTEWDTVSGTATFP